LRLETTLLKSRALSFQKFRCIMPTCTHFAQNNAGGRATTRSRISNRSRMLPGVDGRSSTARRFRDEFGGNISELERDLIHQAAGLTLRAEQLQGAIVRGEPISNDELVRISSTAKRLLETIRAKADKRKPAGPTLQEYLAQRAQKAADTSESEAG